MVSAKRLIYLNLVINMMVFKVYKVVKDGIALLFNQSFMRLIPGLHVVTSLFGFLADFCD